jgi:hypothetical protein
MYCHEKFDENIDNIKIESICYRFYNAKKELQSRACELDINLYERKKFVDEELKKIYGSNKDPLEMINESLEEFGFKHKISIRDELSLFTDKIDIVFFDQEKRAINFLDLSSGEQIIIELIIWSYDFNGKNNNFNKLLMLDEFDAHLNPSMAKMYIKIVEKILIGNFKMQVILTTHSPSTVAYAPDDSLFWMENGKILFKEDEKLSKSDILEYLSDGMTIIDDDFFINTTKLMSANQKDCIIFMEEKSGKRHLENAMQCFGFNYTNVIFPCGGASKILPWFQMPINPNKKVIILDNDEEGKIAHDKIKLKYPESKILFITGKDYYDPLDKTKVIEDLIDTQYYENRRFNTSKSKVNFANVLSKKNICDKKIIYIKFKVILTLLARIYHQSTAI